MRTVRVLVAPHESGSSAEGEAVHEHRPARDTTDDPAGLFRLVCRLLRRRDPSASQLLQRLQSYPDYADGWLALARALRDLGQAEAALVALDQALASSAATVDAAIEKAGLMMAHAGAAKTAQWLAGIRQRWPNDVRLTYMLGRAQRRAGALEAAYQSLHETVAQAPDHAEAWFELGLVAQDLSRQQEAAQAYRSALDARPGMFEAALNLGISLQATGAIEPAMDAYALAVQLQPACFNRVAQALTAAATGRLWLDPAALRRALDHRT